MKKWIIIIGYFILLNIIFLILDGTPFITDFILFNDFGKKVLQTDFFTNWFNFYETQLFNIVLLVATLHLLLTGLYDLLKRTKVKHS